MNQKSRSPEVGCSKKKDIPKNLWEVAPTNVIEVADATYAESSISFNE